MDRISLHCLPNLRHPCPAWSRSRRMSRCRPRVFRTETLVPSLTRTVVRLVNSRSLRVVSVVTRLLVIIMALPRVKAARYLASFYCLLSPYVFYIYGQVLCSPFYSMGGWCHYTVFICLSSVTLMYSDHIRWAISIFLTRLAHWVFSVCFSATKKTTYRP